MNYKNRKNGVPIFTQKVAVSLGENDAPMLDNILYNQHRLIAIGLGGVIDISTDFSSYDIKPMATYFSDIHFNLIPVETL